MIAHRIQLKPTRSQEQYFLRACGTARFVYNWALAEWIRQHKAGLKPSAMKLKKEFNAVKYGFYPWLRDVHRDAHAQPFFALQVAFKAFFTKTGRYPVFKRLGRTKAAYYIASDKLRVVDRRVRLPRSGWVKLAETPRFSGRVVSATVSRTADRWFISLLVDAGPGVKPKTGEAVLGVDLGVKTSVTCSDGKVYQSPKGLRKQKRRLLRLAQAHARKQRGSKNKVRSAQRLAGAHWRIAEARKDFLHKTTTDLVRRASVIAIEDLNVAGMVKNHNLAGAVSDESFAEFRRLLEYKAKAYDVPLILADRFYPSSKTCSGCGNVKANLLLAARTYRCSVCGLELDRDLNAALNLKSLTTTAGYAGSEACGPSRDGMKQEFQAYSGMPRK